MKISDLKESDFQKYFSTRLQDHKLRKSGSGWMALCPLHLNTDTPALSVKMDAGVFYCHAGCGKGGILEFETKFSSCDKPTALRNISEIIGQPQLSLAMGKGPDHTFSYQDANGKELFQVLRYNDPPKRIIQRRKADDGSWIYKTSDIPVVLYRLPEVITANFVAITEGELKADVLLAVLTEFQKQRGGAVDKIAVTTSPRGAGKWLDGFAPFFTGKKVCVFQDNDEPGVKHATQVAASVYRYANGVKIVSCPAVNDVHDYIKAGHTAQEIIQLIVKTPAWKPDEPSDDLFMSVIQFEEKAADHIDWLVEALVQRGSNGLFLGRGKAGKSLAITDLALALASGQKWFDFYIPKRAKVALVSREDNYSLTQLRVKKLRAHRGLSPADLDGFLYINAKGLRPKIMLDYESDVTALISALKYHQSEFLILDVMRVLHGKDENDGTELQNAVINALNRIHDSVGCSICLVHHTNKDRDASLTESARGTTSIVGWAEFVLGIKVENEDDPPAEWVRKFMCEIKADLPPDPFHYRITGTPEGAIKLERVDWEKPTRSGRKHASDNMPF